MIQVFCFSGSGHSHAVAAYFAQQLQVPVEEIGRRPTGQPGQADTALVVFPVYCENIPTVVKGFLYTLAAKYVALVATYGRISHGNVLWEASKLIHGCVIAAAYVPMGHTYLDPSKQFDPQPLHPMFGKLQHPQPVVLKREKKHLLSSFFPAWRSRIGVVIRLDETCDACNICTEQCPMRAIEAGHIHSNCIRCLRCIDLCPISALHFELRPILKWYLTHAAPKDTEVYL